MSQNPEALSRRDKRGGGETCGEWSGRDRAGKGDGTYLNYRPPT